MSPTGFRLEREQLVAVNHTFLALDPFFLLTTIMTRAKSLEGGGKLAINVL